MITYNQLELVDVFKECQDFFETDKPQFLKLLEENVDLDSLIPRTFSQNYYAHTGRPRGYQLVSMLWALILQRILFDSNRFPSYCFPSLLKEPA